MIKDDRMQAIYDAVRSGVTVCDVGTDHGILPIELIIRGKASRCIMTDISAPSLEKGVKNAKLAGVAQKIDAYNTNGTLDVQLENKVDFIIAGMGGELIAQILLQDERLKNPNYGFVLQPMSKAECLRTFLAENGFEAEYELKVEACQRIYPIIRAHYCGKEQKITLKDKYLGYGFDPANALEAKYAEKILTSLKVRLSGVVKSEAPDMSEIDNLKTLIECIETEMKNLP